MMFPQSISYRISSGAIDILWENGAIQHLNGTLLRRSCRCADCTAKRRDGTLAQEMFAGTEVIGMVPVGAYAIQLIFSDGHARGIFPWPYLKNLADEAAPEENAEAEYNGSVKPLRASHGNPD